MPLNLYSKASVDNLLADKLDLAGGTMTGALTLSASGIIFSDATYLTTAPAGATLAADQLTAGVVAANPTSGPTTAGDVLTYNGSALVWSAGGGGGGVAWGAITGTVTDQTDLVSYISGLGYQTAGDVSTYVTGLGYLTDAPSDGQEYVRKNAAWSVATGGGGGVAWGAITGTLSSQTDLQTALDGKMPVRSVNTLTSSSYTLASGDANNIVYVPPGLSGGFGPVVITVPDDASYSFAVGTVIQLVVNNTTGGSDINFAMGSMSAPTLVYGASVSGSPNISSSTNGNFLLTKVGGDLWVIS